MRSVTYPVDTEHRNSANDALFRKQELLFGLHHAADAIRRSGEALLVEGPLDVIQLHQAGFPTAVASMGTSLSPEQRQALLRAGAKRLLIAYDGDTAGRRATARLIEAHRAHAIAGPLELAVVALPAGSDPDDIIRTQGPEALQLQLLAPLVADPENLSVLQHCELEAKRLLALLPQGALWQRADQRLKASLGVVAPVLHSVPKVRGGEAGQLKGGKAWAPCGSSAGEDHLAARPKVAGLELPGATAAQTIAIERAERRALRLFLCNPGCRDPLAALVISTDLYRRALHSAWWKPIGA